MKETHCADLDVCWSHHFVDLGAGTHRLRRARYHSGDLPCFRFRYPVRFLACWPGKANQVLEEDLVDPDGPEGILHPVISSRTS
jgi:hypothetical protein